MAKPKKGVTLTDFLHLKKDECEEQGLEEKERFGIESEKKMERGIEKIEEEKEILKEKETPHIYAVYEVTKYIRQKLDRDVV
ncbi:MAG TPA: hypothetical protein C5S37_04285, partial [Methanophagales archaeon]|nr:hypothetical protein [Methanophagales archaeon]